jgi:hypothetical protein
LDKQKVKIGDPIVGYAPGNEFTPQKEFHNKQLTVTKDNNPDYIMFLGEGTISALDSNGKSHVLRKGEYRLGTIEEESETEENDHSYDQYAAMFADFNESMNQ